jgi:hypothetical protein
MALPRATARWPKHGNGAGLSMDDVFTFLLSAARRACIARPATDGGHAAHDALDRAMMARGTQSQLPTSLRTK